MKKKLKIVIPILLVIILSFGIFIFINSNNRNEQLKNNESNTEKNDTQTKSFYIDNEDKNKDGIPDTNKIVKDKNGIIKIGNLEIYNPNETYYFPDDIALTDMTIPKKDNINIDDLNNYLKSIIYEIGPNSYKDFNENNIDNLMLSVSFPYSRVNKETVKQIAKIYFDIDNYEFPIGTYHTNSYGEVDVIEINNLYVSKFNQKFICPCFKYKNHKLNGDELVVQYEYVDYGDYNNEFITSETPYKVLGTSNIYLNFNGDNLNLKRTEYIPS